MNKFKKEENILKKKFANLQQAKSFVFRLGNTGEIQFMPPIDVDIFDETGAEQVVDVITVNVEGLSTDDQIMKVYQKLNEHTKFENL